ncbi:MAG: HAD family hydrolase [Chloroflexi bacterium]|nr:HAD family hydrolase [Chloroflexota bacterium]
MSVISGVIFDLGRTLLHFTGDEKEVIDQGKSDMLAFLHQSDLALDGAEFLDAFSKQLDFSFKARLEDHVERPTEIIFHNVMAELGYPELSSDFIGQAMRHFYSPSENHWVPNSSMLDVLDNLHQAGAMLALLSNAGNEQNVYRLIEKANIEHYFEIILVSAGVGMRKPDHSLYRRIVEYWNIAAKQIVMIGDSLDEDILGAKRAGMHTIWLMENVNTPENQALAEKIKPDLIAGQLGEIPALIQKLA